MNYSIILFVIFVFSAKQIYSQNPTVTAFKELKAILSNGYDKDMRPDLGENKSTDVGITLHIMDIEFDEKEKKLNTDMYFRQLWTDSRLSNPNTEQNVLGAQTLLDSIWTPDTFFPGSMSVRIVKYPKPNVFVKIAPNGTVFFSQRLQHTSRCHRRDQTSFECTLSYESYGNTAKDIKYYLKKGPSSIGITEGNRNELDKQYKLANYTIEAKVETFSFGEFSRVMIKIIYDNQPTVTSVTDTPKEVPKEANTNDLINEGKKIHKMFSNIKFDLPTFPIKSQN